MDKDYLIILIFLVFLVFLYTYAGMRFIRTTRGRKRLIPFFILGLLIGLLGGVIVFYNMKITGDALYFTVKFERWWYLTVASIIFGGILSLLIFFKITKR